MRSLLRVSNTWDLVLAISLTLQRLRRREYNFKLTRREAWKYFHYPNDRQNITAGLLMKNPE